MGLVCTYKQPVNDGSQPKRNHDQQRQLLRAEARHLLAVRAAPGRLDHRPPLRRRVRRAVHRARAPGGGHHVLRHAGLSGRNSGREKEVRAMWVNFSAKQKNVEKEEEEAIKYAWVRNPEI